MNTAIKSFVTNRKVVALSTAALGFVVGGVVGTFITRRMMIDSFLDQIDTWEHDSKMKKLQDRFNRVDFTKPEHKHWSPEAKQPDPRMTHEQFNEERSLRIINGEGKDAEAIEQAEREMREAIERRAAARHHTFDTPTDDWDYEKELTTRENKEVYVIHRDEYIEDAMGYHQSTIEFYVQDAVMTDALQHPIHNYTDFVGHEALDMFGHGSGDNDVVYVRNDREKSEFEVLRNSGSYEVEVLGLEVEDQYAQEDLKHSKFPSYRFPIRE